MPGFLAIDPIPAADGKFYCCFCRAECVPQEDPRDNDSAAAADGSVMHFRCMDADLYALHLSRGGHP